MSNIFDDIIANHKNNILYRAKIISDNNNSIQPKDFMSLVSKVAFGFYDNNYLPHKEFIESLALLKPKVKLTVAEEKQLFRSYPELPSFDFTEVKNSVAELEFRDFTIISRIFENSNGVKHMKKIVKNNKDIFRQNDKKQVGEYFQVSSNIWSNKAANYNILVEFTDMMIDAFNCSIVFETIATRFVSHPPQGYEAVTFSKYISKRLINETILLSTLLSSPDMYKINSLSGMSYDYRLYNVRKLNALIYFVKYHATIGKNATLDDKILENMENVIGNTSRIENEIIKKNKKVSRYTRSNIAVLRELQSYIYVEIVDKFKYIATQNIWDKCFNLNNSGLFKAISKNGCATNIKFTSEHMKYACSNLNTDMVKFLLDQRILPSVGDMQVLMLSQTSSSSEILEIISSYTKNIPQDIKAITDLVKRTKDSITSDVIDILKLTSDDLKEMRRKFYLKSSYSKLETKNSVLLLQKLFLFDRL